MGVSSNVIIIRRFRGWSIRENISSKIMWDIISVLWTLIWGAHPIEFIILNWMSWKIKNMNYICKALDMNRNATTISRMLFSKFVETRFGYFGRNRFWQQRIVARKYPDGYSKFFYVSTFTIVISSPPKYTRLSLYRSLQSLITSLLEAPSESALLLFLLLLQCQVSFPPEALCFCI